MTIFFTYKQSFRRNFWSSRDVKRAKQRGRRPESKALWGKRPQKSLPVIPWTSGLLSCQAPLLGTAWSANPGTAKSTNLPQRDLGKGTDLVCDKGHWAKSHLKLHRSCIVFLGHHVLQLLLQVLLSRVLDINVVTLWAGKVAADALCEESASLTVTSTTNNCWTKPCAFQMWTHHSFLTDYGSKFLLSKCSGEHPLGEIPLLLTCSSSFPSPPPSLPQHELHYLTSQYQQLGWK